MQSFLGKQSLTRLKIGQMPDFNKLPYLLRSQEDKIFFIYKMVQAYQVWFLNGQDHKPNTFGHPNTEQVRFSSPTVSCEFTLNTRCIFFQSTISRSVESDSDFTLSVWNIETGLLSAENRFNLFAHNL